MFKFELYDDMSFDFIERMNSLTNDYWKGIRNDQYRHPQNIALLIDINKSVYDLNKNIKRKIDLGDESQNDLPNVLLYKKHITLLEACISSINYKFFKDSVGIRILVDSISSITSHPSMPAAASSINTVNSLTQHHVNNFANMYKAKNMRNGSSNYVSALNSLDYALNSLLTVLLKEKKKYLVSPMTNGISEALLLYNELILNSKTEDLKEIFYNNVTVSNIPSEINQHISKMIPELKICINSLLSAQLSRNSDYNNWLNIGYSKKQKIASLEKLSSYLNHYESSINHRKSIYKLNDNDKAILQNGKTGEKLNSFAQRTGFNSFINLLGSIENI